ncbi:catalase, partial [Ancylobacter sonchi]|nr:catalase [Ancylobacter sonchi]
MARKATTTQTSAAAIHDQTLLRGNGGELHQVAERDTPVMTTAQGGPVADDQNTLKVGPRGPSLIEDFHFRE